VDDVDVTYLWNVAVEKLQALVWQQDLQACVI